ncbi:MAG: transporter substrate-binding protein, partial [Paenibacillus sp.]|nr:transporter substrate-binding protein [Paenibacillus sp.]
MAETGWKLGKTVLVACAAAVLAVGLAGCKAGGWGASGTKLAAKTKPLELNFFLPANNNAVLSDDDFVKQAIEQKFNVKLQVTAVPSSQVKEKLNLLIASGSTPDLLVTDGRSSLDYHTMGIVGDLSKLLTPQNMPNYFRWITPKEVSAFQFPDAYDRGPVLIASKVRASYYIRKD